MTSKIGKSMSSKQATYIFMVLPCLICLMILTVFPILYTFYLGFHNYELLKSGIKFIGLDNYRSLTSDPNFWGSLKVTLIFTFITVMSELVIGFLLALLLNQDLKGIKVARVIFLVPMIIAPVTVGVIWRLLFHVERGPLNYFLQLLGLKPQLWLSNPRIVLASVILVDIWKWTPFVLLILLAGLQSLPGEIYEAGKVDGASGFELFRYFTIPLLQPYVIVALTMRTIDSLKTFDYLYVLTGGGPGRTTEILNIFTYYTAFRYHNIGYASAVAFIIFLLAILLTLFLSRGLQR